MQLHVVLKLRKCCKAALSTPSRVARGEEKSTADKRSPVLVFLLKVAAEAADLFEVQAAVRLQTGESL